MTLHVFNTDAMARLRREHAQLRGELRTALHRLQRKIDTASDAATVSNDAKVAATYDASPTLSLGDRLTMGNAQFSTTHFDFTAVEPQQLEVLKDGIYWFEAWCQVEIDASGNEAAYLEVGATQVESDLYETWIQPVSCEAAYYPVAGSQGTVIGFPTSASTIFVKDDGNLTGTSFWVKGVESVAFGTVTYYDLHTRCFRIGDVAGTFTEVIP